MKPTLGDPEILKLEDILHGQKIGESDVKNDTNNDSNSDDDFKKDCALQPRGRPKSGRFWKGEKKRARSMVKSRGLRQSFKNKQTLRNELKHVKELTRSNKEERAKEREGKRQRRQENLKRQEENRKKAEIVQVIRNTSKIKKMKKKQLRTIEKRDTNDMIKR